MGAIVTGKVIEELVSSELSMEVPRVVVSAFPTTESPVPAHLAIALS